MPHRFPEAPRSCDLLDLVDDKAIDRVNGRRSTGDASAESGSGGFLVWLVDDKDTVVVRSASSLPEAAEAARAYRAAWGGHVRFIEGPDNELVPRSEWGPLVESTAPLPYVFTVELRSPHSTGGQELVSALWTSTDLAEALRWRNLLPVGLRRRTLVVSNAPDGHYPYQQVRGSISSDDNSGSDGVPDAPRVVRTCSSV
ncbi:hypothetical protein [Rhodococcus sp. NBC_00297]|uniref:hypothetical protein n=1 Tax=Rhodococcus sp. NBC_00297 TaxID=2976005 RepID=UPI002E2CB8FF|nr:hypothetical protein [Rhodococcus sp. NBC_00297]